MKSSHESRPGKASSPGHLREKMSGVTAWIDSLREAFGKEMVDKMIRTGLREETFWAVKNGLVVACPYCKHGSIGTADAEKRTFDSIDAFAGRDCLLDDSDAVSLLISCSCYTVLSAKPQTVNKPRPSRLTNK